MKKVLISILLFIIIASVIIFLILFDNIWLSDDIRYTEIPIYSDLNTFINLNYFSISLVLYLVYIVAFLQVRQEQKEYSEYFYGFLKIYLFISSLWLLFWLPTYNDGLNF